VSQLLQEVIISPSRVLLDKVLLLLNKIEVLLRKSLSPKLKITLSMLLKNPFLKRRKRMVQSS
jgi:hypothetical protein